eukprot:c9404_g1_i1.p1 GENE.c9404_g1_i1~~c9404_g1_i1.p1  ORF type:complete len:182 (+),score=50.12 c9404_g1_i1:47-547(+)
MKCFSCLPKRRASPTTKMGARGPSHVECDDAQQPQPIHAIVQQDSESQNQPPQENNAQPQLQLTQPPPQLEATPDPSQQKQTVPKAAPSIWASMFSNNLGAVEATSVQSNYGSSYQRNIDDDSSSSVNVNNDSTETTTNPPANQNLDPNTTKAPKKKSMFEQILSS